MTWKDNLLKIRIPEIHGISSNAGGVSDDKLPYATVSGFDCFENLYEVGDIVWVSFENNNLANPVVLGQFLKPDIEKEVVDETDTSDKLPKTTLLLKDLEVKGETKLGESTSIGKVNQTEISYLSGVNKNIQVQFDSIRNTDTLYNAKFYTNAFEQLKDWKLDSKGIFIKSDLFNSEDEYKVIKTTEYSNSAVLQKSILNDSDYETNSQGAKLYYTEGYNKDVRQRTNWMGAFGTENDTTKAQFGLFARNYWGSENLFGTLQLEGSGQTLAGGGIPGEHITDGNYYLDSLSVGYDIKRHLGEVAFLDAGIFARTQVVDDQRKYEIYELGRVNESVRNSGGVWEFSDSSLPANKKWYIERHNCNQNKEIDNIRLHNYVRYRIFIEDTRTGPLTVFLDLNADTDIPQYHSQHNRGERISPRKESGHFPWIRPSWFLGNRLYIPYDGEWCKPCNPWVSP